MTTDIPRLLRLSGIAILVICIVLAYIYQSEVYTSFTALLSFIQLHPIQGAIYYIIIYAISAVFCIPAVILTLGSGYIFTSITSNFIFGFFIACSIDFFGAILGSLLSFWTCKLLFYEYIQSLAARNKKFMCAQMLIKKDAIRIIILLRILMPYNLLNYLLGITNVSVMQYILSSIGMLPSTIGWCFMGSTVSQLSQIRDFNIGQILYENPLGIGVGCVFICMVVCGIVWISKKAKKEFDLMIEQVSK